MPIHALLSGAIPQHTVTWAILSPLGPVVGIMGGHSPLHAQHGTTKLRAQDRGQRAADRSLGICLPCLLMSLHHSGSPPKSLGVSSPAQLRPLPGWHVGVRAAERETGAANPWARRETAGRGVNSLLPRGLCLPMAVSSGKLSCAGQGSPSFLPSENLLSATGQTARTCALHEFR